MTQQFKRFSLYLTPEQWGFITEKSLETGVSKASLIRLLVDEMMKRRKNEDKGEF